MVFHIAAGSVLIAQWQHVDVPGMTIETRMMAVGSLCIINGIVWLGDGFRAAIKFRGGL